MSGTNVPAGIASIRLFREGSHTTCSGRSLFYTNNVNNNKAIFKHMPDSIGQNEVFRSRQNMYYATLYVK